MEATDLDRIEQTLKTSNDPNALRTEGLALLAELKQLQGRQNRRVDQDELQQEMRDAEPGMNATVGVKDQNKG